MTAFSNVLVYTAPCAPLTWVTGDPLADGSATISAEFALANTGAGMLVCGDVPGDTVVFSYRAGPVGSAVPAADHGCDAVTEVATAAPGTTAVSKLFGYEKGSPAPANNPHWFSSCSRTIVADMTLPSSCEPFQSNGVAIDLTQAAATIPAICVPDAEQATVNFYSASDLTTPLARVRDVYCGSLLFFAVKEPVLAGTYTACVLDSTGVTVAECTATIAEGEVAEASCAAPTTCPLTPSP